ncbi:MAG: hypothetical protein CR994_03000 [Maribacter sp.]|nr:MAG: hypothetical protein CR994_03000 [Maribacter sp.]
MKHTKSKILVLVLTLFGMSALDAQEKGISEVGVGYGIATSNELIQIFTNGLIYPASLGTINTDNQQSSGAIYAEYNYAVANRLMIGGDIVYERFTEDVRSNNTLIGKQTENVFTIAIKSNYNYISKPNFRLYSGIGLGYSMTNQKFESNGNTNTDVSDDNTGGFNFHLAGLGIRVGNKMAFKAELGFGYKGIISGGLNYRF